MSEELLPVSGSANCEVCGLPHGPGFDCENLSGKSEQAAPTGATELERLQKQNAVLRSALEGWVKYFQSDVPMTADAMEQQGEDFTHCWFETQNALNPQPNQCKA